MHSGRTVTTRRRYALLIGCAVAAIAFVGFDVASFAGAEAPYDENVRARMLRHRDGTVAHVKTRYNDIFVVKRGRYLFLTTRYAGVEHFQSVVDLKDPDELMAPYTRIMSVALAYPRALHRILMIGLGAGSISTYLARAMPAVRIDTVELDPGIIAVAKKYFGLRETANVRLIEGDGRLYLSRHAERYDVILLDAFKDLGVPLEMRTQAFYALVRQRLTPSGVAAFNIAADADTAAENAKFYRSSLTALGKVFERVDVYPDWTVGPQEQAIAVAAAAGAPGRDALMRRARALQDRFRFRYALPDLVGDRLAAAEGKTPAPLSDDVEAAAPTEMAVSEAPFDPLRRFSD